MPEYGTFNLHGSLLPDYRGAAPINWAVMNGEKETGLTTFFLRHEIDTGDIIFQEKLEIKPDETAGELHDRMMVKGAELVLKTVQAVERGEVHPVPQPKVSIEKTAPKIFKEDCRINWHQPVQKIHDFIRGLSPYPGAWTMLDGKVFKIYLAQPEADNSAAEAGTVYTDEKSFLKIAAEGGYISAMEVQLEGRKKMGIEEFLRGYKIQDKKLD
jgi:methionyl-tRNA formyltransferase